MKTKRALGAEEAASPTAKKRLMVKLAVAGHGVLLLPAALALWAFGWRRELPLLLAASLAWSLIAVSIALAPRDFVARLVPAYEATVMRLSHGVE